MRRNVEFMATLVLLAGYPGVLEAIETAAYSSTDIIRHFAPARVSKYGATRSVCIGSGDCGAEPASTSPAPAPFDLEVSFELGSDRLTADAKRNLDEFAKALAYPSLTRQRFSIDGHTDGRGGDDMNLKLSQRRADAVKSYLVAAGVDATRLTIHSYGKTRPKTDDPLDAANRRVETRLAD